MRLWAKYSSITLLRNTLCTPRNRYSWRYIWQNLQCLKREVVLWNKLRNHNKSIWDYEWNVVPSLYSGIQPLLRVIGTLGDTYGRICSAWTNMRLWAKYGSITFLRKTLCTPRIHMAEFAVPEEGGSTVEQAKGNVMQFEKIRWKQI